MAKVYTWSPDTPLGFMNEEIEALWAQQATDASAIADNVAAIATHETRLDNLDYVPILVSGVALGGTATENNIYDQPVVQLSDGSTEKFWWSSSFPDSWKGANGDFTLSLLFATTNTTASQNVVIQARVRAYGFGTTGATNIIAQASSIEALPTTSYHGFEFTLSSTNKDVSSFETMGGSVERLGSDGSDNYTGELWCLGGKLIYTPA